MDEVLEKVRQQFNYGPYPRHPLEKSPKDDREFLWIHDVTTPYYLRYRQRPPQDLVILDAGCGSGYKALALAFANPGAKIVGIDFSPNSVDLATKRFEFHGMSNYEFHVLPIDQVGELGLTFDYINCDEVLYLMPDPVATLATFKQVLKPLGILRVNVHNQYQREMYFKVQEFFGLLGLMQDNPEEFELKTVQEIMGQLNDRCELKRITWSKSYEGELNDQISEFILMNCLLQGDKGFTIPQIFGYLEEAGLEFIEMVAWPKWRIKSLFKDPDNLPTALTLALEEATPAEVLHLVNLLHAGERLLDLWCGHPNAEPTVVSQGQAMVSLHPQLRNETVQQAWQAHLQGGRPLILSDYLKFPVQGALQIEKVEIDAIALGALWPLFEGTQSFESLLQRWLQLYPRDLLTLEPVPVEIARTMLRELLLFLEQSLYVLLTVE